MFSLLFWRERGGEVVNKGFFVSWSILLDFSLGIKHRHCDWYLRLSMIITQTHTRAPVVFTCGSHLFDWKRSWCKFISSSHDISTHLPNPNHPFFC